MSRYSTLTNQHSSSVAAPVMGDVVLSPENTPQTMPANQVFDCGRTDLDMGGRKILPDTLTYQGATTEKVPKVNPTNTGTVANVKYSYTSGGVTVVCDMTVSLADVHAYRDQILADKNLDQSKKLETLKNLDALRDQMENGVPANRAAGIPPKEGMNAYYQNHVPKKLQQSITDGGQKLDPAAHAPGLRATATPPPVRNSSRSLTAHM
ncbi:MAG: hypothetical protein WCD70_15775 [Alphaproteobacteria bacterium]